MVSIMPEKDCEVEVLQTPGKQRQVAGLKTATISLRW